MSQGAGDPADFEEGAALAVVLAARPPCSSPSVGTAPLVVTSINVPTCVTGEPPGLRTLPVVANAPGPDSPRATARR